MKHGGDWAAFQEEYGSLPLDFSANISPLGIPRRVLEAAGKALESADRYPDPASRALRRKLALYHGIPEERIVCGNGAADLIHRLVRCLRPKHALLTVPGFGEYRKALSSADCSVETLHLRPETGFRLNHGLTEMIRKGTDLVFLTNPNNPTGALTEREELLEILSACREAGSLLVVDECFMDFVAEPERFSLCARLPDQPGLVILKAFTKSWAMAGLRLGYVLCGSEKTAEQIADEGQPWPVSLPAEAAGIAALEEQGYLERLRELISSERRRMRGALAGLGLNVIPGEANYLLFYSEEKALSEKLRKKGILLRDCSSFEGLEEGWYRTAVRTEAENEVLLRALREVLQDG